MKLSIIIPVYNAGRFLDKCLKSVANQTFKNYEVILINDGSSDNSEEICLKYTNEDNKFRYYCQSNMGAGAARNKGIELSTGEYIVFIDADDWIDNDYIENIVIGIETYNVDLIVWGFYIGKEASPKEYHTGSVYCNNKSDSIKKIYELKNRHLYGFTVQFLYKKNIIDEYGIKYPTDITLHEDMIFANKYCGKINTLATIDILGYHYVDHETTSLSGKFLSSDQCLKIAEAMFSSAKPLHINSESFIFEAKLYMGYLSMSVVNMYLENKVKPCTDRWKRIKYVNSRMKSFPLEAMGCFPKKRRIVLKYFPVPIVDLVYMANRLLK